MIETRLVNTSFRILNLFLETASKEFDRKNLTSGAPLEQFIELANFGSNKIIENIGKDRSHISKAIQYLKKNELLEEHGKWQEGKTKNTRLTKLGLYIAFLNSQLIDYNKQYLEFQTKIQRYYTLPNNIPENEREFQLKQLGWEPEMIASYELSLGYVHMIEFGLMSFLNTILVSQYMTLILKKDVKKNVRTMLEYKIIESFSTNLQNLTFTNLSLDTEAREFVISKQLSTLMAPSFNITDPIMEYLQFDFDDLPNDGNRKFVKNDVKRLLSILFSMMELSNIPVPRTVELEKYKTFLDVDSLKKRQEEFSSKGAGSQMFEYNRIEKLGQADLMSVRIADRQEYDATDKFVEIFIAKKSNPKIPIRKVARCAFFRTKLIISVPSELKINAYSDVFIKSYEEAKKLIYDAFEMIDYPREFDDYGVGMPIFNIIIGDNNLIKRITVDDLVADMHKILTFMLIDRLIIIPLERSDPSFAKYLSELKTSEKDFTWIATSMF